MKSTRTIRLHLAISAIIIILSVTVTILFMAGLVKTGGRFGGISRYPNANDKVLMGIVGTVITVGTAFSVKRLWTALKRKTRNDSFLIDE